MCPRRRDASPAPAPSYPAQPIFLATISDVAGGRLSWQDVVSLPGAGPLELLVGEQCR